MDTAKANNRIVSIDVVRGLAVFFMIAVHTLEVFGSAGLKQSTVGEIIEFLGGPPAAPVFMTLMGLSMVIAGKTNLTAQLKRGLFIFLSGYVLNILRAVIPLQCLLWLDIKEAQSFPLDVLGALTIVDILQFAGLAMMILAVAMNFRIPGYIFLLTAFLIILISPFLWGSGAGVPIFNHAFELFWGDKPLDHPFLTNKIAFPLFPWLAFPLLGVFLGKLVVAETDPDVALRKMGWGGLVTACIGLGISATNVDYHFNDYYHSRQGAMIFMCGFVALWLSVFHWITKRIAWNEVFQLLTSWSKGVTNIYLLQWIMILWTYFIWRQQVNSLPFLLLMIGIFTGLCHFINKHINKYKTPN